MEGETISNRREHKYVVWTREPNQVRCLVCRNGMMNGVMLKQNVDRHLATERHARNEIMQEARFRRQMMEEVQNPRPAGNHGFHIL